MLRAHALLDRVGVALELDDRVAQHARVASPSSAQSSSGSAENSDSFVVPSAARLAVDRDARGVRPAVGHLGEHRAEVGAEPLLDVRVLGEQSDDPAHG